MEKQRKNTRRNRGITLIALVITIIILLILAGVTINSILGNNSLLVKVKQAKEKYNQSVARERLELVLFTMQAEKVSNLEYNENEYLTSKIEENDMKVTGDFVIVDGWEFEINRSVPQIVSEGDKEEDIENNEGLIGKVSKESESGYHEIVINKKIDEETTEEIKYPIHIIVYKGDLVLDGIQEVEGATLTANVYEFGNNTKDVATENENAKNMVIFKVEGNLTINENVTLTSCKSDAGYGGPKGMMIFCTGKIYNKGIISMTARGAKAEGEDVYLWQNSDGNYEYVPAIGASGGNKVTGVRYKWKSWCKWH